jgi:hypothetical protein
VRRLALVLLFLLVSSGALVLAITDHEPLVKRSKTISPSAIAQARRLLLFNDPRHMQAGTERRVALPATLIDEGINSLASRMLRSRAAFVLTQGIAELHLTLQMPWPRWHGERFLNLRVRINESQGEPRIASAAVGRMPISARLAEFLLLVTVRTLGYEEEWLLVRSAVRRLTFEPRQAVVLVDFVWQPALLETARSVAIEPTEIPHIREAQERLWTLLGNRAPGASLPLREVLKPMLEKASDQPRQQRRAALLVLAVYLAQKNLAHLIPSAQQWPQPPVLALTLRERHDIAQHFVVSAALAAWAGEPAAEAIGLYKELDDALHGGGFSFADLAADRAGTRFGELLTQHPDRLDALLQAGLNDDEIMPALDGLPNDLSQREFQKQLGKPGSPAYQRLTDEIGRRLDLLPLYQ